MQTQQDRIHILLRIIGDLAKTPSHPNLIQALIEKAVEFTGAERGFLVFPSGDGFRTVDINGEDKINTELSSSTIRRVFESNEPLCLIEDAEGHSIPATASILALDLKTLMVAPLIRLERGNDPAVFAVLYVDSRMVSRPFDQQDLDLFNMLARHAAVAWRHLDLTSRLKSDFKLLKEEVQSKYDYHRIIGQCEAMRTVYNTLEMLRNTDIDVMITGETGTGKELIAKAIHYSSTRSDAPLTQLNCAALPEGLVEAELFGVEKNVATGVSRRAGKLEKAHQGTLFLDEIADMPIRVQNRLLRFLEERRFRRIGGRDELSSDARVLAATNKNMDSEIASGTFRDALKYRLDVVTIHLPPLKDRGEDLDLLADFFLKEIVDKFSLAIQGFTVDAWKIMREYTWPGNVRELRHRVQSAAFLSKGQLIETVDLGIPLTRTPGDIQPLDLQRRIFEKNMIERTLQRHEFHMDDTAGSLDISKKTLKKKMSDFGIQFPESGDSPDSSGQDRRGATSG